MPPYLLGIDIGAGGAKALVVDAAGVVIASATEEYPLYTPRPLWSEQESRRLVDGLPARHP